jgi:hypothetical protein
VTRNMAENVVEYQIADDAAVDSNMHDYSVVLDYNREIQLIKVLNGPESFCFLVPLNRTRTQNAVVSAQQSCPPDAADKVSLYYERSAHAIKDIAMLGSRGQQLCADTSAFWLFPVAPYEVSTDAEGSTAADVACRKPVYTYSIRQYSQDYVLQQQHGRQKRGWKGEVSAGVRVSGPPARVEAHVTVTIRW